MMDADRHLKLSLRTRQAMKVTASIKNAGQRHEVAVAAMNIQYKSRVESTAAPAQVAELLKQTDAVAEVHNTLRLGAAVELRWSS